MDEIKKAFKKFIDFLGGTYQAICWLIVMFLIWYLVDISIAYSLPLVIVFWLIGEASGTPKAQKFLALSLKVLIVLVLAFSLGITAFPRTKAKVAVAMARIDQIFLKPADKVEVLAEDLWEKQKQIQGKKFTLEYNRLLAAGKPQEAADTLRKFNEAWDMKIKVEKPDPDPIFFSETSTLQKGDQWFTDKRFKIGDRYKLVVEGTAVKYYTSDGSKIIQPGVYPDQLINSPKGALAFEGINKRTKVTVTYSR
jgi:hypothetical protein